MLAISLSMLLALWAAQVGPPLPDDAVYFSPPAPDQPLTAEAAIAGEVGRASRTIRVQAYSFTSIPVARALVDARARGVDVRVIVDPSDEWPGHAAVEMMVAAGIPVMTDAAHAIAHNKVIVIDSSTVLTGSYNFTASAAHRNAENLRIRRNDPLAGEYLANWSRHAVHRGTRAWARKIRRRAA